MDVYELVAHFPIFKLIPNIVDGFKREHLNIEVDQDNDYYDISQSFFGKERALTQIQMNNYKTKAQQDMGLRDDEMEYIREFFDEEIRGRDALTVLGIYKLLFRDIKDQDMKQILIGKITKFKGNNFEFFHKLACIAVKDTTKEQQLEFLFDLFADFKEEITILQFEEFRKVFKIQILNKLSEEIDMKEFVQVLSLVDFKYDVLKEAKYLFISMMGLVCDGSHEEQMKSILTYLDQVDQLDL